MYFEISNLKIYPVYTSSFNYNFLINAQCGIINSFLNRLCTNLIMKCHYRHTLEYTYKNKLIKLFAYKNG